jgi:hypothetical protein
MKSSEAIVRVLDGNARKAWTGRELVDAALPLMTGVGGKDPAHTVYMNLHKEAARADGIVVKSKKDGKTTFRLNPRRRELRSEKVAAAKADAPAKRTRSRKPADASKAPPRKRSRAKKPADGTPGPKALSAVLTLDQPVEAQA